MVFLPCTARFPLGSCCTTCTAILSPNFIALAPVAELDTSFEPPNPSEPFSDNPNHLLIKDVKVSSVVEDFSEENRALVFKTERSSEVYIVLPCGRRPSIRCGNGDYFEWDGFRLIKKVDCEISRQAG